MKGDHMKNIIEDVKQNISELRAAKEYIEEQQKNEPQGSLRVSKSRLGTPRYYQKYTNEENILVDKYIPGKEKHLAQELAEKSYYNKLYASVCKELKSLENLERSYTPDEKYNIYRQLTAERKALVEPFFIPAEERAEKWEKEEWISYDKYKDRLIYETERGELVRSKSEVIIANMLYQKKDRLSYRYEAEIYLKNVNKTVHPDFTILNKKTGKTVYWEHAGMLNDAAYSDDFVRKMNWYIAEGIVPGEQLILSFETADIPLNIKTIRRLIEQI